MGYTKTTNAIVRVREYLDEMVIGVADLEWPSNDPRLAFYIREGIAAAKHHSILDYATLGGKYIIRSKEGKIVAELRNKLPLDELRARMTIKDAIDGASVIGAAIQYRRPEMYFPNAQLTEDDLQLLHVWATSVSYFIIAHEPEALTSVTLTKRDPGELRWEPSDEA